MPTDTPLPITRNPRVAFRPVGDGSAVLLNLDTGAYHSVNATARVLWDAVGDGATTDDLADVLVRTYGLDPDEAVRDAQSFVEALSDRQLLVTA